MKKTVQINIGHRLFTIDEDAFQELSSYLTSLKNYFGDSPESQEIISDIEYRIADLLSERDQQTVSVSIQDVDSIIATMGTPSEIDGEEITVDDDVEDVYPGEKKLVRIDDGKVIAGVCNGIADYFNINVPIVRLIFILLAFGTSGTWIIVYIALWIMLPEGQKAPWNAPRKKLFRDPENKVLGGVLSGIAQYFGYSVQNVRLVFALPFILLAICAVMGPFGFIFSFGVLWPIVMTMTIIYIILWISLPVPANVVDRMDMKGQPINIDTIKNTVYDSGSVISAKAQSMGNDVRSAYNTQSEKIKTGGLGRALGIVLKVFLVLGIFVFAIGIIAGFTTLKAAGLDFSTINDFIFRNKAQEISAWIILLVFLFTPIITLVYFLTKNTRAADSKLGYIIGGLWIFAFIGLFLWGTNFAMDFRTQVSKKITQDFPATMDTLYVKYPDMNDYEVDYSLGLESLFYEKDGVLNVYNGSGLKIKESPDNLIHIYTKKTCQGRNMEDCKERLAEMKFDVSKEKDSILLQQYIQIHKPGVFRGQRASIVMEVPKGIHVDAPKNHNRKVHIYGRRGQVKVSYEDEEEDNSNGSVSVDINEEDGVKVRINEDNDTTVVVDIDDDDFE